MRKLLCSSLVGIRACQWPSLGTPKLALRTANTTKLYTRLFFRHFAKNSDPTKTQGFDKTQLFSKKSGPKTAKTYLNRKKISSKIGLKMPFPPFLWPDFQKTQVNFEKTQVWNSKNIPQPETWYLKKLEKVSKKKPAYELHLSNVHFSYLSHLSLGALIATNLNHQILGWLVVMEVW